MQFKNLLGENTRFSLGNWWRRSCKCLAWRADKWWWPYDGENEKGERKNIWIKKSLDRAYIAQRTNNMDDIFLDIENKLLKNVKPDKCLEKEMIPLAKARDRSSRPEVFCRKVFLEISRKSQENSCVRVSALIKLQVWVLNCEISKNTSGGCFSRDFSDTGNYRKTSLPSTVIKFVSKLVFKRMQPELDQYQQPNENGFNSAQLKAARFPWLRRFV